MKRRTLLQLGAAAVGIGAIGAGFPHRVLGSAEPGRLLRSQVHLPPPYQVQLPVPAELQPVRQDAAADYYEVTQSVVELQILPGLTTRAWTYGGSFPGPTIVSRSGRQAVVRHHNALPVPVAVHLHGGHTPAAHDGYPLDLILPHEGMPNGDMSHSGMSHSGMSDREMMRDTVVGQRDYVYPMNQRASTLWYHDHRMDHTGESVWRGLAGFHLIRDAEEDALPLPRGHRDVPLMIADRSFAADGSFHYPVDSDGRVLADYMNGVLGDVILVNGAPWPVLQTDPARYRLRLLNASNARRYRLQLDPPPPDGAVFTQIGSDGGLLERPVPHSSIDIAPAERFDIVIDFSRYTPGTRVRLVNRLGEGPTTEVMRFDIVGQDRSDDSSVPQQLSSGVQPLPVDQVTTTRTFKFGLGPGGLWSINDVAYQPGRPLARPRLGDVEIWRFITDVHHPIHVHLNHFQVLSRNNRSPGPYDSGWKDTVDVQPSEAVEIITRFTDYHGTYLVHCHNLEHEDMAMMADFITA
ncbi:multicopper oxidase domain-containing protein [Mycolicibacterium novocastrense]|uniref:Multicopper oxidase domain-containing protein n=1 Tax=Mycolicibacterium novocastrense TaxID=59813 RepID=A0AAW5SLN4_MYCNV|nr:multicopper oxidase domain-containing protein [Mycolicibacterium novocastrense]